MASSEHSSHPGFIASRPPSVVPSRENSVSTPPTDLPQLPVANNNGPGNKGAPAARTPSGSPPNLPQMPLPMPPMIRRVSQLSNAASSDSSSGNSAMIKDDLSILQVLDQAGKEVIDPTLRDVPAPATMSKGESEMATMGNLPSMGNGQLPSLPLTQWPSLPSLDIYASGAGTDTQPSTQTSSPTSPSSLWPSSFGSYNNSLTDFGSSLGGDTPNKGLSENESDFDFSKAGFDDGTKVDNDNNAGAGVPAPKKKSHARKQPEGHIKRARNAFILFRKHITDSNLIPPSVEVKHQNISVVAAKMWKEAPLEVRAKFNEQARIEKEEHARKYPGYRYQPVFRRTDIIRRRVRKDPAEDEKVDAVAEALIKGKAGENLEKEIKDQIIQKGNESDSAQSEMSSSSSRRRRDVGQLSKGAIRAQKAQARAKQMRQNLLGTNLLNMSLYNAATNRLANGSHAQQSQYQAQAQAAQQAYAAGYPAGGTGGYGMYPMDTNYVTSVGYDIDGRPIQMVSQAPTQGYPEMYGTGQNGNGLLADGSMMGGQNHPEMYRLPPIEGMVDINGNPAAGYENWQAQGGMGQSGGEEYWDTQPLPGISSELAYDTTTHINTSGGEEYYNTSYGEIPAPGGGDPSGMVESNGLEYRLPPLMDIPRDTPNGVNGDGPGDLIASQYAREHSGSQSSSGGRRDERTSKEGQQTPSGHVLFNERLFDGALGTAGLTDKTKGHEGTLNDDDLGMFDQAMEQAGDIGNW
uniref:HMG box domain-containing protein n=1 Tax=Kwoniella bestiolae CBS 10118 TaxID=1296100 RepID=A0A1B9GGB7_9TREE|nr:hypothetical protein I302_01529 [Kwoniella bestiolae CBS 10118]OCF30011.1 hypothetical protein I302_01529 [Kwoniella bestiolae CBS 10118]